MTRQKFPVELMVALALALSGAAPASADASAVWGRAAIIGGAPAQSGTFGSVAEVFALRGTQVGQCTGSVVAPRLILTAGHCVENIETGVRDQASGYRVVSGDVGTARGEVRALGSEGVVSTVSGVIVYEGFHRRVDDGDAALLVLSAPVSAPAITLATSSDEAALRAGATATIAGWGVTSFGQRGPTRQLRSAETVLQAPRWCERNAPPFYAASEICTIDPPRYATGACSGDSGGPLLAATGAGEAHVQIGIAIHVYRRCSTRYPSVFTRVNRIASWVRTWIGAYQDAASPPASPAVPAPAPAPAPASPAAPAPAPASASLAAPAP